MPDNSSSPFFRSQPFTVATISTAAGWHLAEKIVSGSDDAADFLEVRADILLENQSELPGRIAGLPLPVILTVRHPAEGGKGPSDSQARAAIYQKYQEKAAAIDLELQFAREFPDLIDDAKNAGRVCILSSHHFTDTPALATLEAMATEAVRLGADLLKVAATMDEPSQLMVLIEWLAAANPLPVAAMGMGRLGKISRPLLAQLGSRLNYGYLDRPLVPGQWPAGELRRLIRTVCGHFPP